MLAVLTGAGSGAAGVSDSGPGESPDRGESVSSLIANPPPGAPVPPILPPQDGFLFLERERFAPSFAADVDPAKAAFMADSQVPWGVEALAGWQRRRVLALDELDTIKSRAKIYLETSPQRPGAWHPRYP